MPCIAAAICIHAWNVPYVRAWQSNCLLFMALFLSFSFHVRARAHPECMCVSACWCAIFSCLYHWTMHNERLGDLNDYDFDNFEATLCVFQCWVIYCCETSCVLVFICFVCVFMKRFQWDEICDRCRHIGNFSHRKYTQTRTRIHTHTTSNLLLEQNNIRRYDIKSVDCNSFAHGNGIFFSFTTLHG